MKKKPDIAKIMRNDRIVNAALRQGARDAVERAARAGLTIPAWENGRVVHRPAVVAPTRKKRKPAKASK